MKLRGLLVGAGLAFGSAYVVVRVGVSRWDHATESLRARLRERIGGPVAPYSESDLAGLPAPVVRYFRRTLQAGQPMIAHARVQWAGEFNMGTPGRGSNWRPFTAVQEFVPRAPGFVWDARIAMAPGVSMLVRDAFVDGRASMRASALGVVPFVNTGGTPTLASGALQRYLGEAAWFPTALLPRQGVRWSAIDDQRALATIDGGATSVSLEFRFDKEGQLLGVFTADRFYDDGKHPPVPRPWEARYLRFGTHEAVAIPTESIVEWHLTGGTFAYWRGRPVRIEYRYAVPSARSSSM
jgi:hypothetical protein